jgi:hypothetical protein
MQRLFGIDWTDPALYALVLNTARIRVADCVEHIAAVAGSAAFQETTEPRMALNGGARPAVRQLVIGSEERGDAEVLQSHRRESLTSLPLSLGCVGCRGIPYSERL